MMPLDIFQSIFRVRWYRNLITSSSALNIATPIPVPQHDASKIPPAMRPLEDFSQEVIQLFSAPCDLTKMLQMSADMRQTFHEKLADSQACMLPSFCCTLPTGKETGTFVALDVGGSTFRAALVQLTSRSGCEEPVKIKRMTVSKIDETVRKMPSIQFFNWMAYRIKAMLEEDPDMSVSLETSVPLGLAWSFPIEQTSMRGGKIQAPGKGFRFHEGSAGEDIGQILEAACEKAGFKVRVEAVINDSSSVLLSQAYADPATSMGLIMGTGTNAAAFLPVSCMKREKFGTRDESWFTQAERVITNTELSMFGKSILPETRWDEALNRNHQLPDFQPLEYMTTGRYLGEILRLIIVEAVEKCKLFSGVMPAAIETEYSLDTALLAVIEADSSINMIRCAEQIQVVFGLETMPSKFDMAFLRVVVEAISHRAAVYLAIAIHSLWALQKETDVNLTTPAGTPKTSIACNGSVILKYPGFKPRVEKYLKQMVSLGSGAGIFPTERIVLQPTHEAAIIGAAVAVAMADGDGIKQLAEVTQKAQERSNHLNEQLCSEIQ